MAVAEAKTGPANLSRSLPCCSPFSPTQARSPLGLACSPLTDRRSPGRLALVAENRLERRGAAHSREQHCAQCVPPAASRVAPGRPPICAIPTTGAGDTSRRTHRTGPRRARGTEALRSRLPDLSCLRMTGDLDRCDDGRPRGCYRPISSVRLPACRYRSYRPAAWRRAIAVATPQSSRSDDAPAVAHDCFLRGAIVRLACPARPLPTGRDRAAWATATIRFLLIADARRAIAMATRRSRGPAMPE